MRTSSGKVQAWQYAGIGVAMSQAVPTQCARRRVRRSGQLSKLGLPPKPRRCAKPSRRPTLLSLRDRLMAGEGPQGTAQPDLVEGQAAPKGWRGQRRACILLRLNLALAVRISGPPRPVTLRSKVGKGLRGAGVWGGAQVYTSPAPDLQPEQAAPGRVCGLRND